MSDNESESEARRRYKRRGIHSDPKTPREIFQNNLAHKLTPSLGYFFLTLAAGAVSGIALMKDIKPLFVLVFALIPFFGPFFGEVLACASGSIPYLIKSFIKYLLGRLLYFGGAFGAVYLLKGNEPDPAVLDFLMTIEPTVLICLVVTSFLSALSLDKDSRSISALSTGMMFFILAPETALAYIINIGQYDRLYGIILMIVICGLVAFVTALTALLIRRAGSLRFTSVLMCLIVYLLAGALVLNQRGLIRPSLQERINPLKDQKLHEYSLVTYTPTATLTFTPTATYTATATNTSTPIPPTATFTATATNTATMTPTNTATSTNTPTVTPSATPTRTLIPTATPTKTKPVTPTPVYGIIYVKGDVGVLIRERPGVSSDVIKSANNDSVLELSGNRIEKDGAIWVEVLTNEGLTGWIAENTIRTATPRP